MNLDPLLALADVPALEADSPDLAGSLEMGAAAGHRCEVPNLPEAPLVGFVAEGADDFLIRADDLGCPLR